MIPLILTFLAAAQLAGPPSVKTGYLPGRLTVGDRFTVTYTVACANSATVLGPFSDSLGPFVITGQALKTKTHQGYNDNIYALTFAGFKPGESAVPPLRFLVQTGDRTDTVASDPVKITIASVLSPKAEDINEIKPPFAFPNHWLWLIPAAVLLLAVAARLGWVLFRQLRRIRELAAAPLSPWDEALAALDGLPWNGWLADGRVQLYYYSLSEILKRYIERRYGFNAAEQTSTEIIAEMKRLKTPFRDEFVDFIRRADLVKYAKHQPTAAELPEAIETVRGMVLRSRPADPASGPAAPQGAA
ncbi:MAG: hypothetical protein MUF78_04020 [Candidatus Edwardsbacteria bacterium]|jgi:hypothetical protein|nr:hypothetical protein [Candidatus Edwardsbacteria bacterium]